MPARVGPPPHDDGPGRVMAHRAEALFQPGTSSSVPELPLGIAGRMGSGKSTMMRTIAAMAARSGTVVRWVSVTDSDPGIRRSGQRRADRRSMRTGQPCREPSHRMMQHAGGRRNEHAVRRARPSQWCAAHRSI